MTDIAVIILVGREEIHIRRCLEKLAPLNPQQIFVVESQRGDNTHEIAVDTAEKLGWKVVQSLKFNVQSLGSEVQGLEGAETQNWYDVADPDVLRNMAAITLHPNVLLSRKKQIKECFKNFGTVVNMYDGVKATFPAASVGKMLYQSGVDISRVVFSFKRLFESARCVWREHETKMAGHKYHFNVRSYANYVNKFELDGKLYFIRFTLREIGNEFGVHASTVSEVCLYESKTDGAPADSIPENPDDGQSAPFTTSNLSYSQGDVNTGKCFIDRKLNVFLKVKSSAQVPRLLTVFHAWPGNQATQFDWALDNLPVKSTWVLRLDADEYLTGDTIVKLREHFDFANHKPSVATNNQEPSLYTLELRHIFMGGEICHGTAGIRIPRLFRLGHARYGGAIMDERLKTDGVQADFDGQFFDDNLNSFEWWQEKHRGYAKREAEQALAGHFHDPRKAKYYRLPPYLRAFLYFCIRYFLKLGFLDGIAGFRWHFWQGLWYRCLVDREIGQMSKSRPRSSRSSE